MKKCFKKALSVFLSLTMIFAAVAMAFPSASAVSAWTDIPVILVEGQGTTLGIKQADGSYDKVYGIEIPEGYIEDVVKENIDVFARAVLTQEWDEFCDVLYEAMVPLYEEIKLDENGEAPNGSRVAWDWSESSIKKQTNNGKYEFEQFRYHYDWRMDPLKTADDLHAYIEAILKVTGKDKVALSGRCLGSCITMAYMQKYDGEYVSDHILYASALNGVEACGKAFCGDVTLDADGVERFAYDLDLSTNELMGDLVRSFVTVANDTYGLDLALAAVNNVIPDIKLKIFPRILRETYASFPSYWAMVGDKEYEKAKEVVFYGAEEGKYDNFIKMIDNYHYNVQIPAADILVEQQARGIDYFNITKYGVQSVPVTGNSDAVSDSLVDIPSASMGATVGSVNFDLSESYIQEIEEAGKGKYISIDKKIDASTCLFPDQTWFIKNLSHKNFPTIVNVFMAEMVNVDNFNIESNENYPQYLVFDEDTETLSPMTEDNHNTTDRWQVSFMDALRTLIRTIIQIIKNYFASIGTPQ